MGKWGESGHFVPRGKMDNWTIPDLTSGEPSDHQTDPFNIKTSGKTYQNCKFILKSWFPRIHKIKHTFSSAPRT